MKGMSTSYELTGRVQQKRRTHEALVEAARGMVADGDTRNLLGWRHGDRHSTQEAVASRPRGSFQTSRIVV